MNLISLHAKNYIRLLKEIKTQLSKDPKPISAELLANAATLSLNQQKLRKGSKPDNGSSHKPYKRLCFFT